MSENQKFIKLQADQIFLFWDLIKHGAISSFKIPREYQQAFAVNVLEQLLTGMAQAWVGYVINDEGEKNIHYISTTKIVDEKFYGVRYLSVESLYGLRFIDQDVLNKMYEVFKSYALANNCNIILTSTFDKRPEDMLQSLGFEKYKLVSRKILT